MGGGKRDLGLAAAVSLGKFPGMGYAGPLDDATQVLVHESAAPKPIASGQLSRGSDGVSPLQLPTRDGGGAGFGSNRRDGDQVWS